MHRLYIPGVTKNEIATPDILNSPQLLSLALKEDGAIPNSRLPLVVYAGAVRLPPGDAAGLFERLFGSNHWSGSWRDGIYTYHHYHSTAHEVLGVFRGSTTVQFGGEHGIKQKLNAGDVVVIPAGVSHKNLGASSDLGVVGAYPEGQDWDMNYGQAGERPKADQNIARVPLPKADPVYGLDGPLLKHWSA